MNPRTQVALYLSFKNEQRLRQTQPALLETRVDIQSTGLHAIAFRSREENFLFYPCRDGAAALMLWICCISIKSPFLILQIRLRWGARQYVAPTLSVVKQKSSRRLVCLKECSREARSAQRRNSLMYRFPLCYGCWWHPVSVTSEVPVRKDQRAVSYSEIFRVKRRRLPE